MPTLVRIEIFVLVVFTAVATALNTGSWAGSLSIGPLSIFLFDLIMLFAVAMLIREATLRHGPVMPSANRVVVGFVLAYCAYQVAVVLPIAVVFFGHEPVAVVRQLTDRLALLIIPFVYLIGVRYVSPRRIVDWVNIAAVCLTVFAAYKYMTGGISGWQNPGEAFRLRELYGGASLAFGFLIITSLFLRRPGVVSYVMALLGLVGMALTNHRSGYVALLVTVPPLLLNAHRLGKRAVIILLVAASAAILMFSASPKARDSLIYSFQTMLNPTADTTTLDRVDRSKLGWDYFVANPLGDYQWTQRFYLVDVGPAGFEPHNFVIQLLGQQGIVGSALFAGVIVFAVRIGWRNRKDSMSVVMLAYIGFYLAYCLFNTNLLNTNNVALLVIPIALLLAQNATLAEEAGAAESLGSGLGRPLPVADSLR